MSQRTGRVTQRIVVGLILLFSCETAGFVSRAEGTSLFDLKKELTEAEAELKEKELQLSTLAPLFDSGALQNNLNNDKTILLPQLRQKETDTATRLQGATALLAGGSLDPQQRPRAEQVKRSIEAELVTIRGQKSALETSIRMQEERIASVPILRARVSELQRRVPELRAAIPVAEARFSEFMNCYQLALSMKTFNKFTRTGVVLTPSQMEDEHGSSPRKLVANKYYEVYLKHYKTDFNDPSNSARLNQAIKNNLAQIGGQFFDGAQRTVDGQRSTGYVAESAIQSRQEQIAGFRNQYSALLSEGEPICDRMRNFVTQGETAIWDASPHGGSTQAPFTRQATPDFPVPGFPSESVSLP